MATIRYLTAKQFRNEYPGSDVANIGGWHNGFAEDDHLITLPYKASTRVRLHELGHAYHNHLDVVHTIGESISRELDAEIFVYTHMNKAVTWKVAIPSITTTVGNGDWDGYSVNYLRSYIIQHFKKVGHPLSKKDESSLWAYIKWAIKQHRDAIR